MNINHQLFESITDNLNTVLDTVPAHPKTDTKEYGYYAMDTAFSSLMSYYACPTTLRSICRNPLKSRIHEQFASQSPFHYHKATLS